MPGLMELVYTTTGGVVGAAVTNYFAHHQDRRELRAAVMRRLQQVRAVRAGVADIVPARSGLPGPYPAGVTLVLDDDRNAERVLHAAIDDLMASTEAYREATAQLLLRSLWHPWLTRWRVRRTVRGLRRDVAELHRLQESAMSVLTRPEHTAVLAERLGSAG